MDEQSRELGRNNPRRRAQEERAKQAAREAASVGVPSASEGAPGGFWSAPVKKPVEAASEVVLAPVPGAVSRGVPSPADTASPVSSQAQLVPPAPAPVPVSAPASVEARIPPTRPLNREGQAVSEVTTGTEGVVTDMPDTAPGTAAATDSEGPSRTGAGAAPACGSRSRAARPATRPAAKTKKKSRWTRGRIAVVSAGALIVAMLVAVAVGFAWLRWFSADDAADLQGTWYLAGTATPIVITDDRIQLTDDVSYRYTLDTADKTIQFTFGNLAGEGCYRFSLDRNQLALVDGTFTGSDTLNADVGWTIQALWENLQGKVLPPAEKAGKGVTLLSRTPAPGATPPAADEGPTADTTQQTEGGEQVIEDDVVGDLSGKFPADINDPHDKAADEGADAAGAGDAKEEGAAAASDDAAGAASGTDATDAASVTPTPAP